MLENFMETRKSGDLSIIRIYKTNSQPAGFRANALYGQDRSANPRWSGHQQTPSRSGHPKSALLLADWPGPRTRRPTTSSAKDRPQAAPGMARPRRSQRAPVPGRREPAESHRLTPIKSVSDLNREMKLREAPREVVRIWKATSPESFSHSPPHRRISPLE